MTRLTLAITSLALIGASSPLAAAGVRGFDADRATRQLERERVFDSLLNTGRMNQWMRRLAGEPHHPGSARGKENAHFIAEQFRSWGYRTQIVEYHVLMPTPKIRLLELVEPRHHRALLEEQAIDAGTASTPDRRLPPYVAFSPDGDVSAQLVYVNQGLEKDYDELAQRGIDVKGRIVLARYGGSWRGIKPKLAQEKGAVGAILYSDPADDGYYQGDTFPDGAFKHPTAVQRGSIIDLPRRPGDPLTPFAPALKGARRLDLQQSEVLVGIPTLPISYSDALPLLEALGGPVAPARWRGALPVTYHLGPGPAKVRLHVAFEWNTVPIYNVIARLPGAQRPDEWVMRGNHHDAWVHGAEDPVAGLVATMEEARAIGALVRAGWRPKRTIVYAAWDGEEPGLFGSVEWVEDHFAELRDKLVAYINTDATRRGLLRAAGSATLEAMFNEVIDAVDDPMMKVSLAERLRAAALVHGDSEARAEAARSPTIRLEALGSGSDFSGFLQHLGVASLDLGFEGESAGGSYHTGHDTHDFFVRFIDPDFAYVRTLARTTGRLTMRLADADILPFSFTGFSASVAKYAQQVTALLAELRAEVQRHNTLLSEGHLQVAANPADRLVTPAARQVPPALDLSVIDRRVVQLENSAQAFDASYQKLALQAYRMRTADRRSLDKLLMQAERALLRDEGLPGRPWFRHHIYAPGLYTGYGVKTLPGVREGIERQNWTEATLQIAKLAEVLEGFSAHVDRANALIAGNLEGAP